MSESGHDVSREQAPPVPPRWKGVQSLDLVHQLNMRSVELICDVAAETPGHTVLPMVAENREIWTRLELEARHRLARMPFVIVDARFGDVSWWRRVAASPAKVVVSEEPPGGLPHESAEQLMHEIAMFAWQTARWDRTVAQLALGMTPSVADIIAALTPQQVREISTRESRVIEIRWANDPAFWRDMLLAAEAGSDQKLAELRLHAKLLLCGELDQLRL